MIEIVQVKSRGDRNEFLSLPHEIYLGRDTKYVHPLRFHMKQMMGRLVSEKKRFFLARVNGRVVARLGVKVHSHNSKETLNFGFFEALEGHDDAVVKLFNEAQRVAPGLKMTGPFHFRMEDPYVGTLVEGFDMDPYFLMSYNPPYYDGLIKAAGFSQSMDLFTYQMVRKEFQAENFFENSQKAIDMGVNIRTLNMRKLKSEVRSIVRIFNDALSQNWGFEEFVDAQVKEMMQIFRFFIDPRVVAIAMKDNQEIGCLIMIPNYNPIIKPSKGRITIDLISKYLRRRKLVNSIRGYALGVLRKYHGHGVGSAIVKEMFELGRISGYDHGEISWVLANNGPMNELSKAMGGKHNKVYRIYERRP